MLNKDFKVPSKKAILELVELAKLNGHVSEKEVREVLFNEEV